MVVFKIKKEDYPALIGVVTGLIGAYKYHLVLGILTLFAGISSKYTKSTYWKWIIFAGIVDIGIFFIKTFWPGV
jgi:H+/Cl- antiporter ClcA